MPIKTITEQLLFDIKSALIRGDRGRLCVKYEQVSVTDTPAVTLVPPTNAFSALITVEGDATVASTTKVVRYREDGTARSSTVGMPLGHLDSYEVTLNNNITNFKVIGIEAGKTHKLNISYYTQS